LLSNDVSKSRVLVTGGAGYIGSTLVGKLLQANHNVTVVDNLSYSHTSLYSYCSNTNFNFVYGDVRDRSLLKKLVGNNDIIIHLAALVGASICKRDPYAAKSVNVEATKLLANLCSKDQLLIYPTTNSGYGITSGTSLCTEETPLNPVTTYGKTKVAAEKYLLDYDHTSLSIITLRLATLFGMSPHMRTDLLVNDFVLKALTDRSLVLYEANYMRNYVYIGDVARCMLFCIDNQDRLIHNTYNLGNDKLNMSKLDLATKIKEYIPELYIHCAETKKDIDRRNYIVSSKKLERKGFCALTGLNIGIPELIKGYSMKDRDSLGYA